MGIKVSNQDGNISFNFGNSVEKHAQDVVQKAILKIYNSSTKNQAFFDGLCLNVYESWDDPDSPRKMPDLKFGYTRYPIADTQKNIFVKTCINQPVSSGINNLYLNYSVINETVLHELGHIFDYYFANPDPELKSKLQWIMASEENCNTVDDKVFNELLKKYKSQNGLSDSEEYKNAWKSDMENVFKGRTSARCEYVLDDLGYFAPDFQGGNSENKNTIILKDGISEEELELADRSREEVFAQLFACAVGAKVDPYERALITKIYKNTYKVVKKYIAEYLGVEALAGGCRLNTKM